MEAQEDKEPKDCMDSSCDFFGVERTECIHPTYTNSEPSANEEFEPNCRWFDNPKDSEDKCPICGDLFNFCGHEVEDLIEEINRSMKWETTLKKQAIEDKKEFECLKSELAELKEKVLKFIEDLVIHGYPIERDEARELEKKILEGKTNGCM